MNVVEALQECESNIIALKSDLQAFYILGIYDSASNINKSMNTTMTNVSSLNDRGVLRNLKDFSSLFSLMKSIVIEKLDYSYKSLEQKNHEIELLNKDFLQAKYALEAELEMWRKKTDNLMSELSTDKDQVANTVKKKYTAKIEQLHEENQKLRSELDMINNATREQDTAHQRQIRTIEKKLKHESRAIQAEMQKWFEGQTKSLRGNNVLMFNTLEVLEKLNNLNFTNAVSDEALEYTKVRGDNLIQTVETKLRKYQKMESAIKAIKKDSALETEFISARSLLKQFIKLNS